MDRMLAAAADLSRELGTYWAGGEHLARMVLRRVRGNPCDEADSLPPLARTRRLLSGGAAHGPQMVAAFTHTSRGPPVFRKLATSVAIIATSAIAFAPIASADTPRVVDPNSAEGALTGLIDGFTQGFGSSSSRNTPRRPQVYTYPDFTSCNAAARSVRRPGVTAECNPLGGTSTQYQLVVVS